MIFDVPPAQVIVSDVKRSQIETVSHRGSGRRGNGSSRPVVLNAVPFPYVDGYRLMAEVVRPEWDEELQQVVMESVTLDCLVKSDDQVELLARKHYPGWALGAVWIPEDNAPF